MRRSPLTAAVLVAACLVLALPASSFAHAGIRAVPKTRLKAGRYEAMAYWLNADGHVQIKSWFFRLR